jgi:hypothetical protein
LVFLDVSIDGRRYKDFLRIWNKRDMWDWGRKGAGRGRDSIRRDGFPGPGRVDMLKHKAENTVMKTADPFPEEDIESQAVMDHLMTGKPIDPEVKRKIRERATRITQEIRDKFGLVDIAVPAIRELRGELPNP